MGALCASTKCPINTIKDNVVGVWAPSCNFVPALLATAGQGCSPPPRHGAISATFPCVP